MSNPIARVAAASAPASAPVDAPAEDAPVTVFGDDGTMARYYATMAMRDEKTFSAVSGALALIPGATLEIESLVAEMVAEDMRSAAAAAAHRWMRETVDADAAHDILGKMANGVVSMANLNTYGHGRVGHKVVANVPASPSRPSGRIVVVFTPDIMPDGITENRHDDAPATLVQGPRPIRVKSDAPAAPATEDAAPATEDAAPAAE